MPLKSVKLAWLPIQNNPKIKKSLLANSSVSITCGDRSIINCRSKAAIKKMIKSFQRHFRQKLVNGIVDKECLIIAEKLTKIS